MTQAEIRTELGTNILFHDIMKRVKNGNWKQFSDAEKRFEQHKYALTIRNGIVFRDVLPFISTNLQLLFLAESLERHPGKNAKEAFVRMKAWLHGITQDV